MSKIETILAKKTIRGKEFFLVKWDNKDLSELTWETKQDLVEIYLEESKMNEDSLIEELRKRKEKLEDMFIRYESMDRKYERYRNLIDKFVTAKEEEVKGEAAMKRQLESEKKAYERYAKKEVKLEKKLISNKQGKDDFFASNETNLE